MKDGNKNIYNIPTTIAHKIIQEDIYYVKLNGRSAPSNTW